MEGAESAVFHVHISPPPSTLIIYLLAERCLDAEQKASLRRLLTGTPDHSLTGQDKTLGMARRSIAPCIPPIPHTDTQTHTHTNTEEHITL